MPKKSKKRFREQQQFWLDLNKPEEAALSKQIAQLKTDREFASTIRQGIALVATLRQGDLSLLDEMFPQAVDRIFQAGMESKNDNIVEKKLSELTTMVKELSVSPQVDSGPKPLLVSGNLKSLASQPLPAQDDFDDLLDIKEVSPKKGNKAGQNLINSMLRSTTITSDKIVRPSKTIKKQQQALEDLIEITEGN